MPLVIQDIYKKTFDTQYLKFQFPFLCIYDIHQSYSRHFQFYISPKITAQYKWMIIQKKKKHFSPFQKNSVIN